MQRIKGFVTTYFEAIVVLVLAAATAFAVLVSADKIAFLNFFYIPVLTASYFLGRRQGVLVATAAALMVGVYAVIDPSNFVGSSQNSPGFALFLWGAFLVVTAYLVGTLYEAKTRTALELNHAYQGILGLLATLIDAVDKHAEDHSVRVADIAARIAVVLDLPTEEIDNIHVGGLLHEVSKMEGSLDALRKAATFEEGTPRTAAFHAITPGGGLLKDVVGLVETIDERFDGAGPLRLAGAEIPRGARVLACAEEYELRTADKPYGAGLAAAEALVEVEGLSGGRLDPDVVAALITAMEFD